jgi:hypothetical protein
MRAVKSKIADIPIIPREELSLLSHLPTSSSRGRIASFFVFLELATCLFGLFNLSSWSLAAEKGHLL